VQIRKRHNSRSSVDLSDPLWRTTAILLPAGSSTLTSKRAVGFRWELTPSSDRQDPNIGVAKNMESVIRLTCNFQHTKLIRHVE
jgi:hypothetical protein